MGCGNWEGGRFPFGPLLPGATHGDGSELEHPTLFAPPTGFPLLAATAIFRLDILLRRGRAIRPGTPLRACRPNPLPALKMSSSMSEGGSRSTFRSTSRDTFGSTFRNNFRVAACRGTSGQRGIVRTYTPDERDRDWHGYEGSTCGRATAPCMGNQGTVERPRPPSRGETSESGHLHLNS